MKRDWILAFAAWIGPAQLWRASGSAWARLPTTAAPDQETSLTQIYSGLVKPGANGLGPSIAAVTSGNDTYLLPTFKEEKTDVDQAKTLMHEAMWVYTGEKADYQTVVEAEVEYGSYLLKLKAGSGAFPLDFYMRLGQALSEPSLLLASALSYDARLKEWSPLADVLGFLQGNMSIWNQTAHLDNSDTNDLVAFAADDSAKYPNSATFKVLLRDQGACLGGQASVDTAYSLSVDVEQNSSCLDLQWNFPNQN